MKKILFSHLIFLTVTPSLGYSMPAAELLKNRILGRKAQIHKMIGESFKVNFDETRCVASFDPLEEGDPICGVCIVIAVKFQDFRSYSVSLLSDDTVQVNKISQQSE